MYHELRPGDPGYQDPRTIKAQSNYVGRVYTCVNSDQQFVIEEFKSYKEVTIYFIGTIGTRRTVTMNDIERGILDPFRCFYAAKGDGRNSPVCWTEDCTPQQRYEGLIYRTNEGYLIQVVKYNGTSNVTVTFLDNGYTMTTTMQNIKKGQVHNPFNVNKFGGYEGIGPYKTNEYKDVYRRWYNMLVRGDCTYYNMHRGTSGGKIHPTDSYNNLMFDPPFLCYNKFAEWFLNEMSQLNPNYDYDIDKDIMYHEYKEFTNGRKCYGPNTCLLVPHYLNNILRDETVSGNSQYIPKYKIQFTMQHIQKVKDAADKFLEDKALTQRSYSAVMRYLDYLTSRLTS